VQTFTNFQKNEKSSILVKKGGLGGVKKKSNFSLVLAQNTYMYQK